MFLMTLYKYLSFYLFLNLMLSELDQLEVHSCYMLKYMADLPVDLLFSGNDIFQSYIYYKFHKESGNKDFKKCLNYYHF